VIRTLSEGSAFERAMISNGVPLGPNQTMQRRSTEVARRCESAPRDKR
jgi:hypothetical protein